MKGDKKRKASMFKPGHTPHNKGLHCSDDDGSPVSSLPDAPITRRMSRAEYSLVTVKKSAAGGFDTVVAPTCDGTQGPARILRQKTVPLQEPEKDQKFDGTGGMRIIDSIKMVEMMNNVSKSHTDASASCTEMDLQISRETKFGLGWKYTYQCKNCEFVSREYKLYDEIPSDKPGPNPAAINYQFQQSLQEVPIGPSSSRRLLATMDIPHPSRSSMQRTANKIGESMVELNKRDMSEKLELVQEVNRMRGNNPNEITGAFDCRYNSTTIASAKKPGQCSSQAVGIFSETVTDRKFILAAVFENKLCWKGAWLRGKGFDVECPGGHVDCTANLEYVAPHSEYEMAKDIGTQFAMQDILLKYITTDGDARAAKGFQDAYKVLHPMWEVERQADPTHLGKSQFKRCKAANFSSGMFPGTTTRESKQRAQTALSQDVKARCSLVFKSLMKEYGGDFSKIQIQLPKVLDATLRCYDGDCSRCRRYSMVCGGGHSNSWWLRSMFLATNKITCLNMDENDKLLLQEILKMKLSEDAALTLKLGTDTQKVEAFNRKLSCHLPKMSTTAEHSSTCIGGNPQFQ